MSEKTAKAAERFFLQVNCSAALAQFASLRVKFKRTKRNLQEDRMGTNTSYSSVRLAIAYHRVDADLSELGTVDLCLINCLSLKLK
jgi:hypothetical protein